MGEFLEFLLPTVRVSRLGEDVKLTGACSLAKSFDMLFFWSLVFGLILTNDF